MTVIRDRLRWDGRAAAVAGLVALLLLAVWTVFVAGAGLRPPSDRPGLADLPEPRLPAAPEPAPRPPPLPRPIG